MVVARLSSLPSPLQLRVGAGAPYRSTRTWVNTLIYKGVYGGNNHHANQVETRAYSEPYPDPPLLGPELRPQEELVPQSHSMECRYFVGSPPGTYLPLLIPQLWYLQLNESTAWPELGAEGIWGHTALPTAGGAIDGTAVPWGRGRQACWHGMTSVGEWGASPKLAGPVQMVLPTHGPRCLGQHHTGKAEGLWMALHCQPQDVHS